MRLDRTSIKQVDHTSKRVPFLRFSESEVLFNKAASELLRLRGERISFELDGGTLYMMLDPRKGFIVSDKGDGRNVIYCRALSYKIQELFKSKVVKFEVLEFKGGRWPLCRIDHHAKYREEGLEYKDVVLKFKQEPKSV